MKDKEKLIERFEDYLKKEKFTWDSDLRSYASPTNKWKDNKLDCLDIPFFKPKQLSLYGQGIKQIELLSVHLNASKNYIVVELEDHSFLVTDGNNLSADRMISRYNFKDQLISNSKSYSAYSEYTFVLSTAGINEFKKCFKKYKNGLKTRLAEFKTNVIKAYNDLSTLSKVYKDNIKTLKSFNFEQESKNEFSSTGESYWSKKLEITDHLVIEAGIYVRNTFMIFEDVLQTKIVCTPFYNICLKDDLGNIIHRIPNFLLKLNSDEDDWFNYSQYKKIPKWLSPKLLKTLLFIYNDDYGYMSKEAFQGLTNLKYVINSVEKGLSNLTSTFIQEEIIYE